MDGIKKIKGFILGIKYNGKFSLLDKWGSIVDDLLNDKNEYFDDKYFSKISGQYTTERMLFNDETGNYLKITGHDIVYRHATTVENLNQAFNDFTERVNKCIVPLIIDKYNINNFRRIGIVFLNEVENKSKYNNIINSITKIENVNDIRFAQKDTTTKGRLFTDNNDYTNKIYTISIDSDDIPTVSYDYQYYYNPIRRTFKECEVETILKSAQKSMEKDISTLLGEKDEIN